jgi:hypothetical protein
MPFFFQKSFSFKKLIPNFTKCRKRWEGKRERDFVDNVICASIANHCDSEDQVDSLQLRQAKSVI